MSRLQASAVNVDLAPTGVEEVVVGAVSSLGSKGPDVEIDVDETLPPVAADAALLERALANLIANAAAASPPGDPAAGHRRRGRAPAPTTGSTSA